MDSTITVENMTVDQARSLLSERRAPGRPTKALSALLARANELLEPVIKAERQAVKDARTAEREAVRAEKLRLREERKVQREAAKAEKLAAKAAADAAKATPTVEIAPETPVTA